MRRQTPYVCLCFLGLLAACVGARFTYQDLSVPEDGIQGFSITQTFDDNDSWADVTQSSDPGFEVETFPSSRTTDASFTVSRVVDSLYDALFSPRVRTMEYVMPSDGVSVSFPRYASGAGDTWSATSYPHDVQVVDSVSPTDLFRQLSLARFASQRYRVYVVPVAEEVVDGEPSMADLLRELDEEASLLSSQLDDAVLDAQIDPSTTPPSLDVSYDVIADPAFEGVTDSSYEYDPLNYEYEPDPDVYEDSGSKVYYANDAYADSGYDDSYDLALDPYDVGTEADVVETIFPDGSSEGVSFVTHHVPANPRKRYEPFDELPHLIATPLLSREPGGGHGFCHGFWSRLKAGGFSVWTAVLCIACVGMWAYVIVEYRCNSGLSSRSVSARSSDDDSDALSSPGDTKAPLLPLKGEFDGVEAADVYRAYWLKVQHARDHATPTNDSYTLKTFAQP